MFSFTKMHGSGNDFVVLDLIRYMHEPDLDNIQVWANRRKGIGFDQLLLVKPPAKHSCDFQIQIFNVDGSEAEQCGNGAACVAKYIHDRNLSLKRTLRIDTLGGGVTTRLLETIDTNCSRVEVELGVPSTNPHAIPFVHHSASLSYRLELADEQWPSVEVTPIALGNPHAVLFVDDLETFPVARIGALLQNNKAFPESANIEFLEMTSKDRACVRIYERGVGETMACGSGVCAAMAAARLHGLANNTLEISQPGGKVEVSWTSEAQPIKFTGIAVSVFEGVTC